MYYGQEISQVRRHPADLLDPSPEEEGKAFIYPPFMGSVLVSLLVNRTQVTGVVVVSVLDSPTGGR